MSYGFSKLRNHGALVDTRFEGDDVAPRVDLAIVLLYDVEVGRRAKHRADEQEKGGRDRGGETHDS